MTGFCPRGTPEYGNHIANVRRHASGILKLDDSRTLGSSEAEILDAAIEVHELLPPPDEMAIPFILLDRLQSQDDRERKPGVWEQLTVEEKRRVAGIVAATRASRGRYPSKIQCNTITACHELTTLTRPCDVHLGRLLAEADSLAHLDRHELQVSVHSWESTGVPLTSPIVGCVTPWGWSESIVGNLKLALRSSLLSTSTESGWHGVLERSEQVESMIRAICKHAKVPYQPEPEAPTEMIPPPQLRNYRHGPRIKILSYDGWEDVVERLRSVSLLHAEEVRVYESAEIRLVRTDPASLTPISHYALSGQLRGIRDLQSTLRTSLGVNLWDLAGTVELVMDRQQPVRLSPPIVETHPCDLMRRDIPSCQGNDAVLIDGLHRTYLARETGYPIRVAQIGDVAILPIAFASTWEEVTECDTFPEIDSDRRYYRYSSFEEYLADPRNREIPATAENYQYMNYRNLRITGSPGRRRNG